MRKTWRKLLAFALVGVLAGNVACKDYDDEIDDINQRVEALTGTVALKADLQQMQSTVDALNSIDFAAFLRTADFEAQLQRAGVAYKSDLKEWLTGDAVRAMIEGYGYQTAADVQQLIDGLLRASDVQAAFDAMIAAYDIWGAVQGDVADAIGAALAEAPFMTGESALSQSQIDQLLTEIAKAFGAEGSDVKRAIDGWLGEGFAAYMAAYEPTEAFIAKLGIGDAAVAAVKGALTTANSDLVKEINKLIAAATDGNVSGETLKPVFEGYDKKIEALEIRVAEIEGRIQSMVWVPATADEITNNRIDLGSRVTLSLTKSGAKEPKTVVLDESTKQLTWQVTPASACRKIEPEHVSLDVRSVKTRAAAEPVQLTDVKIDAAAGTITVTVSTDEHLSAENGELPAIALHVVVPGAETGAEENAVRHQGIDFLSAYTMVNANGTKQLDADSFCVVKEKQQVAFGSVWTKELDYTDKTEQVFLESVVVAAENGVDAEKNPVYDAVTNIWEAFGGVVEVVYTPETGNDKKPVVATVSDETLKSYLTLGADGFSIKTVNKSLRGETVSSGRYTCSIVGVKGTEYEGYSLELGTVQLVYEFVTTTIDMQMPAVNYVWSYAAYKNNNLYRSEEAAVSGVNVDQYNEACAKNFDVALYRGGKQVNASVALVLTTTPTAESDVKWAELEIRDFDNLFAEGGEYVVKGSCELDSCRVRVAVPVTVKAMPELKGIELPAKTFIYDGTYDYELLSAKEGKETADKYVAMLWAANEAAVKGQITKEEFVEMLGEASSEAKKEGQATLSIVDGAVKVHFEAAALNETKSYMPTIGYAHDCGLTTSVKALGVALNKPGVTWSPNSLYIVNGRAAMKTELKDDLFSVEQKDMSIAYSTKEGFDLTYSIYDVKDSAQAKALAEMEKKGRTKPEIVDGVLSWNDWTALELIIRVEASKGGVKVGEQTFTAYIEDPVGTFVLDPKADNTLYAGESKHVASLVNLAAGNRDCFGADGLNADLAAALKGSVTYVAVGTWNPAVTLKEGVVEVADSSIAIAADMQVQVKVTYTYQFGKKEQTVTLVVKKGTRPAKK